MKQEPLIQIKNICMAYGSKQVLKDCSLDIYPGDRIALMGPSGCGKTTLLKLLLGLCKPNKGTVINHASCTAAVFQEPRLLPWCTAAENVNVVLSDTSATMPRALEWLEAMEVGEAASLYPGELSGGMAQRVSLARALAVAPDLLMMDEPFTALDEALAGRIMTKLSDILSGKGAGDMTLVMATHSTEWARMLGCKVLRYDDGKFILSLH